MFVMIYFRCESEFLPSESNDPPKVVIWMADKSESNDIVMYFLNFTVVNLCTNRHRLRHRLRHRFRDVSKQTFINVRLI